MPKSSITKAEFRMATKDDAHLDTYDNTKLQAYNTCPTWGVVTYQMHKVMPGSGRSMALEAGSAMHEVFAWVRLLTLLQQVPDYAIKEVYNHHGMRLFGEDRWDHITNNIDLTLGERDLFVKNGAIAVLESSEFYDDPRDKRRTLANLTECAFAYIDRWNWNKKVWMRDENNPCGDVGIEIPFDLVISITEWRASQHSYTTERRYTGKIDGISIDEKGNPYIEENKTAARLGDAWSMAFEVNTQPTGYMIAASVFTEQRVRDAEIHGLAIPLPKSYDFGGVMRVEVSRKDYHIERWINWFHNTALGYEKDKDDPYNADRYTHSCNRYFRPCSLIPFCDADDEEARAVIRDMEHKEWSPLDKAVVGDD
ncbi:unnamed protein product [Sphagnum balticum]